MIYEQADMTVSLAERQNDITTNIFSSTVLQSDPFAFQLAISHGSCISIMTMGCIANVDFNVSTK